MKLFFDTSALLKLYHEEAGTEKIDTFLRTAPITGIILSELSQVEFNSAVWKKVRTGELEESDALGLLHAFQTDFSKYEFVQLSSTIIAQANEFIIKYGIAGLRALDAIQLSCANSCKQQIDFALSSDKKLELFLKKEGIAVFEFT